jgi:hypothetical protein
MKTNKHQWATFFPCPTMKMPQSTTSNEQIFCGIKFQQVSNKGREINFQVDEIFDLSKKERE